MVVLRKVGIVLGLEVSRLARSCLDWYQQPEVAAVFNVLIGDEDGLDDPSDFNARLLLGLKGTFSEIERYQITARMQRGRLSKARCGEYAKPVPVRIGPWSVHAVEPPRVKDMTYRAQPANSRMRVAFAMCGDPQIELVQSVAGPNLYEEFLAECGEGVQHLGIHVTEIQASTREMWGLGYDMVQSSRGYGVHGDGAFAYFATADRLATLIELIQLPRERFPPLATFP